MRISRASRPASVLTVPWPVILTGTASALPTSSMSMSTVATRGTVARGARVDKVIVEVCRAAKRPRSEPGPAVCSAGGAPGRSGMAIIGRNRAAALYRPANGESTRAGRCLAAPQEPREGPCHAPRHALHTPVELYVAAVRRTVLLAAADAER